MIAKADTVAKEITAGAITSFFESTVSNTAVKVVRSTAQHEITGQIELWGKASSRTSAAHLLLGGIGRLGAELVTAGTAAVKQVYHAACRGGSQALPVPQMMQPLF